MAYSSYIVAPRDSSSLNSLSFPFLSNFLSLLFKPPENPGWVSDKLQNMNSDFSLSEHLLTLETPSKKQHLTENCTLQSVLSSKLLLKKIH